MAIAGVLAANHPDQTAPIPQRIHQGITFSRDHGPFAFGKKLRLSQAEAAAGFHFVRPDTILANDSIIKAAYFERMPGDPTDPDPCIQHDVLHGAIDYTSGILITVELMRGTGCRFDVDPNQAYREMAASNPDGWRTTSINGTTALLARGDNGIPSVRLTVDGVEVILYARYAPIPLDTLVEVAKTLS